MNGSCAAGFLYVPISGEIPSWILPYRIDVDMIRKRLLAGVGGALSRWLRFPFILFFLHNADTKLPAQTQAIAALRLRPA